MLAAMSAPARATSPPPVLAALALASIRVADKMVMLPATPESLPGERRDASDAIWTVPTGCRFNIELDEPTEMIPPPTPVAETFAFPADVERTSIPRIAKSFAPWSITVVTLGFNDKLDAIEVT